MSKPKTFMILGNPETWGIIPGFLNPSDPRSAKEQINEAYVSGWQHFPGLTLKMQPEDEPLELHYPDDPPMRCMGLMIFGNERLAIFEGEWVVIIQEDDTWEVCRLD